MKNFISISITTIALLLFLSEAFSQTLEFGTLESFEAFAGVGAITNSGTATGDAGTNAGIISGSGFDSANGYTGTLYNNDATTIQARIDLLRLYIHLDDVFVTQPSTHAPAFGGGETINPGVYSIGSAGSLGGAVTLDGGGDADAVFIMKFEGAFTVGASAEIILAGGTRVANVFWISQGAISVATTCVIRGTLFAHPGAVTLGVGSTIEGRLLTSEGAITIAAGGVADMPVGPSTIPINCIGDCNSAPAVDVLGSLQSFALFSSAGAVANAATSGIVGAIGTNGGAISGFLTSTHTNEDATIGAFYNSDAVTTQATTDLDNAYVALMALPNTVSAHTPAFGSGETLTTGVYHIAGAGSLAGSITLDGENNPDAIFVFKFAGAFSVAAQSRVILVNGAKRCNIFWISGAGVATGAMDLGTFTYMKGTLIAHGGACSAGANSSVEGRMLSTGGAIGFSTGVVYIDELCFDSSVNPIDAVEDVVGPINGITGGTTATLIVNDVLDGNPVVIGTDPGNVILTGVTVPSGFTLNPNGTVTIPPNTPTGDYELTYEICEVSNPTNCDSATSTIVVSDRIYDLLEISGLTNILTNSWTISTIDYDNDGDDDLFFTDAESDQNNKLFRNNGGGTFSQITSGSIVTEQAKSMASSWADFDNDGDLDLIVANNTLKPPFFYVNDGNGTFTKNITAPFTQSVGYYHHVSWIDVDNDGKLELYFGNYWPTRMNELWRQDENGDWTLWTENLLSQITGSATGATWTDYDNDGFQDLLVLNNENGNNRMYRNLGNGQFEALSNGITQRGGSSVASTWGDIDNDGDMDLFIANASNQNNELYVNEGNGDFTFVETGEIVNDEGHSHGALFADVDKDGDLDLFVTNDTGENLLYINNGLGSFLKKTNEFPAEDLGTTMSGSFSDIDLDGDLDLISSSHSNQENHVFLARNTDNNWVNIRLEGTVSNRSAVGASIRVKSNGVWQLRQVNSQTGIGGQSSYRQYFGFGTTLMIDSIEVKWPSGYTQILTDINPDQNIIVVEDNGSQVRATAFYDANSNCVFDSDEVLLENVRFSVNAGETWTFTNANGEFAVNLEPSVYSISLDDEQFVETCANVNSFEVEGTGSVVDLGFFALQPVCYSADLQATASTTIMRRGFSSSYFIYAKNNGLGLASNSVLTALIPSEILIDSASLEWTSIVQEGDSNLISWNLGNISYEETVSLELYYTVSLDLNPNDEVECVFSLSEDETDCNGKDDTFTDFQSIFGSIDPNDILAYPTGDGKKHFIRKTQEITYRIRFENVGNYYAQFVNVIDTLPAGLEMSDLYSIASSHLVETSAHRNILHFHFPDILLPDSATDNEGCHGYVQFTIKQAAKNHAGMVIPNAAAIQFDYNEFICTNEVFHTIMNEESRYELGELQIYPNPAGDHFFATAKTDDGSLPYIREVQIFSLGGVQIASEACDSPRPRIRITNLDAGQYLVLAKDELGNSYSGKLIKIE